MSEKIYEINVFDILNEIWKQKVILISIIFLSLLAGFIYYQNTPKKILVKYEVHPVLEKDVSKYSLLNSIDFFQKIDSISLKQKFIEQIISNEEFIDVITKFDLIDSQNIQNQEELQKAIEGKVGSFKIKTFDSDENSKKPDEIIYHTDTENFDLDLIKPLFKHLLNTANENVRLNILNDYEYQLSAYKYNNDVRHKEILKQIENLENDFFTNNKNKIIFFGEEQLKIAKSLNIKRDILFSENAKFNDGFNDINLETYSILDKKMDRFMDRLPRQYYLSGYELIEQELNILKSREIAEPYVPEISFRKARIREINQDEKYNNVNELINNSPLNDVTEFKSIRINTNYFLKVNYISNLLQNLLASFFIGLLVALATILYRSMQNKKTET